MIRRILLGTLAGVMMLSSVNTNVLAQDMESTEETLNLWKMGIEDDEYKKDKEVVKDAYASGDFEYTITGGTVTITGYTGSGGAVTIPNSISGMTVASIGEKAFSATEITSVTLNSGLTKVDYCAFYNCDKLTSVNIPASVMYIERSAFSGCEKLASINLDAGNTSYRIDGGVLFNSTKTELMCYPGALAGTSYTVPASVTKICESAFEDTTYLQSVTIPDSVTYISDYAFAYSAALKSIEFPGTIKTIRPSVCYQSTALENVVFNEGTTYIDSYSFADCRALKSVTIPKSVTTIASYAFRQCWFLEDVYYAGTEAQWNDKNTFHRYSYNEMLDYATIHYNYQYGNNGGNSGTGGNGGNTNVDTTLLEAFVERMYTVALNRASDEGGLKNWVAVLKAGTYDGAGIAAEFILGDEFRMRNLSDYDYINVLYKTFFGRDADEGGRNHWLAVLGAGYSREYVLSQFVNLDEFKILCKEYEIDRGVMFENGTTANPGISRFVNRLYEIVLEREADKEGLYIWAIGLVVKTETAQSAAKNFFGSTEYTMKNVSNEKYVSDLYKVFMDREADAEGLAVWVNALSNGMTRTQLLETFSSSDEFRIISSSYGL